ncbi:MAG: HAD family phosphatase [Negativicutes bacterium]|nr:HAD family phosphatase [Negativicutes bacterium]
MSTIQGAIFDFDGTLLDSMHFWSELDGAYLLRKSRLPKPQLSDTFKKMSMQETLQYLQTEYGIEDSQEAILAEISSMAEDAYRNQLVLKEGALQLLTHLRQQGVRMCIATANHRPLVEIALQRFGLTDFFSALITCTEIGCGKDQPEIFYQAHKILATPKAETLVFEDSLHAVITAKAAGFRVIGVYDESSREDAEAIRSLTEEYLFSLKDWKPDW